MNAWNDPRIQKGFRAQLAQRRARMASGEVAVGWKVGFGTPAALEKLNLSAPLVGFIMQKALLPSGSSASIRGWHKPAAEPEIAVYLGADLEAGRGQDEARHAIAALGPAIELADVDGPTDDVEAVLSCDIFQRHVVLGPRDGTRSGIRLEGLSGRVTRSGKEIQAPADLESNIGKIVDIVRHVADTLGAFGETLRAGEFIITGSLIPPLALDASDGELVFLLDPVGSVAIRFSH
jgi:2-keto-4-pentenoate hydratase